MPQQLIGYARVSTADQDLESQRQRLIAAGVTRIFDDVLSGRTFDRPGLKELLDYVRPGDCVCVVRLDRLGRSLRQLLETVDLLRQKGIGLVSQEEKLDTTTASGELIFHIFAILAHYERRLIGERTKDGLKVARANGSRIGRPPIDPTKLDAAFKLIDSGYSPVLAAKQVGIGRSSVYRKLQRCC